MTAHETPVPESGTQQSASLELIADDDGDIWTLVPADADRDDRITNWISVEADGLRDLSEWR